VLDDGAVDHELVGRGLTVGGRGLTDQGLQEGGDDGVVPQGGLGVVVGCCGGEGGGAGLGGGCVSALRLSDCRQWRERVEAYVLCYLLEPRLGEWCLLLPLASSFHLHVS
jgi:hypothetical protein